MTVTERLFQASRLMKVAYGVVCSPGEVVPELDSAPRSNTSDAAVLLFPSDIVPVAKASTKKAHSADFKGSLKLGIDIEALPKKREHKANKLMNPDEGYDLSWLYAERQKYGRIRVLGNGHNLSAASKVPSKMRRMQQMLNIEPGAGESTVARDEEAPVLVDIAGKKSKLLVVGGKMSNYNNAVLEDAGVLAEGLVGLRIKAWWPFDEMFYDGLIQSYNPLTKKRKDMVILRYKDSLLLFSWYLQQFDLDGNRVNQGLTVYGNKGSTDQHAYIQQLREGVHNFFATFVEVLRDRPPGHDWELEPGVTCGDYLFGMLQGTRSALYANDRESITVTVEEVTPRSVGGLIALYERAVGIYASLVNINAYHQPGVEAGKKAAAEVLALQKRVLAVLNEASCKEPVEPLTLEEVAERCHAPEEIEMIYKIIAHMAANDRAIIAEGSCGSPRSIKVFLGECNVDELYA